MLSAVTRCLRLQEVDELTEQNESMLAEWEQVLPTEVKANLFGAADDVNDAVGANADADVMIGQAQPELHTGSNSSSDKSVPIPGSARKRRQTMHSPARFAAGHSLLQDDDSNSYDSDDCTGTLAAKILNESMMGVPPRAAAALAASRVAAAVKATAHCTFTAPDDSSSSLDSSMDITGNYARVAQAAVEWPDLVCADDSAELAENGGAMREAVSGGEPAAAAATPVSSGLREHVSTAPGQRRSSLLQAADLMSLAEQQAQAELLSTNSIHHNPGVSSDSETDADASQTDHTVLLEAGLQSLLRNIGEDCDEQASTEAAATAELFDAGNSMVTDTDDHTVELETSLGALLALDDSEVMDESDSGPAVTSVSVAAPAPAAAAPAHMHSVSPKLSMSLNVSGAVQQELSAVMEEVSAMDVSTSAKPASHSKRSFADSLSSPGATAIGQLGAPFAALDINMSKLRRISARPSLGEARRSVPAADYANSIAQEQAAAKAAQAEAIAAVQQQQLKAAFVDLITSVQLPSSLRSPSQSFDLGCGDDAVAAIERQALAAAAADMECNTAAVAATLATTAEELWEQRAELPAVAAFEAALRNGTAEAALTKVLTAVTGRVERAQAAQEAAVLTVVHDQLVQLDAQVSEQLAVSTASAQQAEAEAAAITETEQALEAPKQRDHLQAQLQESLATADSLEKEVAALEADCAAKLAKAVELRQQRDKQLAASSQRLSRTEFVQRSAAIAGLICSTCVLILVRQVFVSMWCGA